ncbi:uncharacterized protein HaLaN_12965 [Haematococcus lacustris]|uniref:Uncharacterized protein n=1 Tax=Haematococcus lacustris TaxID=44745 RepID=A0A699ZL67_HAELA|nr:uncharacterized protein HaLaN_12965 [Haematococcus lacustris]
MDIVQELELYLKKTQLDAVVRELMVDALSSRSEDPLQFLLRWILEKNAGLSSPKVAVASDASVHVAISHPDPSTQKSWQSRSVTAAAVVRDLSTCLGGLPYAMQPLGRVTGSGCTGLQSTGGALMAATSVSVLSMKLLVLVRCPVF